jgi:hypothetical protein
VETRKKQNLLKIGVFARKRACTKWQKISSLEKLQHAADGGKYSTLLLRPDILDNQGKSKVSPPEARV